MITVADSTIKLLSETEGFNPSPYSDGYGYSIGYGHFIGNVPQFYYGGVLYNASNLLPENIAKEILIEDIEQRADALNSVISVPLSRKQQDALLKWSFSLSPTGVKTSVLPGMIERSEGAEIIKTWWRTHYITVTGVFSDSLADRRIAESELFFSDSFPYSEKKTLFSFFSK